MNYADAVKKSRYKTSAVTTIKEQAIIELGRNLNYLEESLLLCKYNQEDLSINIEKVCNYSS